MRSLIQRWQFWFALVCAVGAFREGYFHLVHEPLFAAPSPRIGSEFEVLRPLISGDQRIGYVSDEPLDTNPTLAREHGMADMIYAAAQYTLAPTILVPADQSSELVLANFRNADALDRFLSAGAFTMVLRPSPNLALLHRR